MGVWSWKCWHWQSVVAFDTRLLHRGPTCMKCSYTSQKWLTLVTGYRQLVWTFPQVGRRTGNLSILPWCVPTPSHYYHSATVFILQCVKINPLQNHHVRGKRSVFLPIIFKSSGNCGWSILDGQSSIVVVHCPTPTTLPRPLLRRPWPHLPRYKRGCGVILVDTNHIDGIHIHQA